MTARTVELSTVAEVRLGRQRSPKNHFGDSMRPYLRAANIGWDGLKLDDVGSMQFTDAEMSVYRLNTDDILLSEASGTPSEVGKPAIWSNEIPDCAFQNTLIRVRAHSVLPRYLLHYFSHQAQTGRFAQGSRGVGIRHLGQSTLAAWPVPCPPLDEQAEVAARFDQIQHIRTVRMSQLADVEDLASSLRRRTFTLPGVAPTALGAVASFRTGGTLGPSETFTGQPDGFLHMKVSDMNRPGNRHHIVSTNLWSGTPGSRSATCPAGSVVIPKRGGAIGTNKKRITTRPTVLDPNLIAITPTSPLRAEYLYEWFQQFDLNRIVSGSSVPQLNKQDLAPLVIPVPPDPVQERLISQMESVRTAAASITRHLELLDELVTSLQHQAFSGR